MATSYLRFPHLRAESVVFVAEDDVWLAPLVGGRAYRLSADRVPVADPRLSPDGSLVAWTSWAAGAAEVHVGEVDGGGARRLTYWGDRGTRTLGWASSSEVLALSATGQPSDRRTLAHVVGLDGGPSRVLPVGPVADVVTLPGGGTAVLSAMMTEPAWWKRYRGGTVGKLWLDAGGGGEFVRLLGDVNGQLSSLMLVRPAPRRKPRLAFLSDHEGWGNVYSTTLDGTDLRRHTDHGSAGDAVAAFYARHASTDGLRVTYQCAGELWVLDSLDSAPRRLDIRLGGPRTARTPYRLHAGPHLDSVAPDTTGRTSVVQVRGTVHRLTHRDGPARTLAAQPGVRAREAMPLGPDHVVWVDDAAGEDTLVIAPLDSTANGTGPRRLGAGQVGRVLELAAAPDGSRVALAVHDGRLLVVDTTDAAGVESGGIRELARGVDGEVSGLAFSPDGAWLAWSDPAEPGVRRIMLARLADGELVAATEPRFYDTEPMFTLDGRYLGFLSRRSFDPVYDAHSFDLSFPFGCRPYLVPLGARTPSPFGASPDGRPVQTEKDDKDDKDDKDLATARAGDHAAKPARKKSTGRAGTAVAAEDPDEPDGAPAPVVVVVDVEGLPERVVPVPVDEARYHSLSAGKDCLLWLRRPMSGALGDGLARPGQDRARPALERYDLPRRRHDVIADAVSAYGVSADGTRLVVRDGNTLRVLRTDRSGSGPPGDSDADEFEIDTDRLSVTVDPTAEWRQMYDEAGRLMRDHFWVADMAGVDWAGELSRYRPLVEAVGGKDDLVDLLREVNGELGTSHAYVQGARGGDWSRRPGLLGADLERDGDRQWRIARVLPGESSDPRAGSPLTAPGVDVRAGDVLLEVGGRPVDPVAGPAPLLVGTADEAVELTVRAGTDGEVRRVVVFPLDDDGQLRYQDWVAGRRAFVAERSGGRLGYLHLPDMGANGWAQVHRDLRRETGREGLIVDVRENGGGHISQLIVEKLARRVIGWDVMRHGEPESYPAEAPRGPVVGVTDEFAGSDGDIVTAAFQRMGIGPVVGVRTWGGVIGIDGRYRLVDGTGVTQPRYAFWFDHSGWDIENYGVEPDVEVVMAPQDWVAGRDPQLAAAVDLGLEALTERPAAAPPDPSTSRPSRDRPILPPR